jgi:histidinol-phosphatase (PHP family)
MRDACARAAELGLPGITFTDHADFTPLVLSADAAAYIEAVGGTVTGDRYEPPPLDIAGYLDGVDRCRQEFPGLRIRAGARWRSTPAAGCRSTPACWPGSGQKAVRR